MEFISIYAAFPLFLALALPPDALFPGLFVMTAVGLVLLDLTPGFRWNDLTRGAGRVGWAWVGIFTAVTFAVCCTVVILTEPAAFFVLPRELPGLMVLIAVLYPPLSAIPQEIIFRPLFFRRYGSLLPTEPRIQVVINAAVFSAAHLMYWSWLVAGMTFAGGLAFAWSYRIRRNFPEAVLLHSLAGLVLFGVGLGTFFYSGNIKRPF